jgi:hypothetical protein
VTIADRNLSRTAFRLPRVVGHRVDDHHIAISYRRPRCDGSNLTKRLYQKPLQPVFDIAAVLTVSDAAVFVVLGACPVLLRAQEAKVRRRILDGSRKPRLLRERRRATRAPPAKARLRK